METPWSFTRCRVLGRSVAVELRSGDVTLTLEPAYDWTGRLDALTTLSLSIGRGRASVRAPLPRLALGSEHADLWDVVDSHEVHCAVLDAYADILAAEAV